MKSNNKPTILLVEDNNVNQRVAVLMLNRLNYTCDIASDGEEAFEMYKRNRYDLVFMDIQMPCMDGWESTKAIRDFEKTSGLQKRTHIFALTASEACEIEAKCDEVEMDGFIEKPIRSETLSKVLNNFQLDMSRNSH